MKALSIALMLLCKLLASISFIWIIVAFCLYLFKDKPFEWASVWCFVGFSVCCVLMIFPTLFFAALEEDKKEKEKRLPNITQNESSFQKRLRQLQERK